MRLKKLDTIGNIVFDYIISVVILNLSLLLIIPFIPLWVGYQKYVETDLHSRSLRSIFINIKENLRIVSQLTLFLLIIFGFAFINLLWLETEIAFLDIIIKIFSYIMLWIGLTVLIYSPTIITNMNVKFKELIYNSIMLIFGGIINYILSMSLLVVFMYLSIQYIFVLVFGIPLVIYMISRLSILNLNHIKEKMK
ncbi:MAG TPA: hypothetical protein DEG42_04950 [Acholeplasmataceae bacterium]|nr:MAG: hypothetical protein A2Y43_00050 [Tenericutes bacterium GWA2_38_26]OHE30896.1 MAG: hypothetical protein A2084_00825 [Tenericutes bacterium GWC2_39_45]HBY65711.1 hypothetical protein [Acholeplasmataceae bacterium]HCB67232.1 hypothetical protein [Acholeplasmataceae bacterium]